MESLIQKYSLFHLVLISLCSTLFLSFPNIACIPWQLDFLPKSDYTLYFTYFTWRFVFFSVLIWYMLLYNLFRIRMMNFRRRLVRNLLIVVAALVFYNGVSFFVTLVAKDFMTTMLSQFCVIWIGATFAGHIFLMYSEKQNRELEIERLKNENLQSRCDALTNQINPHFFFNSLNGLSALIRKKDDAKTLAYLSKLSDVFRYILQSDKKGLVTLREELGFVDSFRYMMEVRFANKLVFVVDVPESAMERKIPALSILPLIDNVVMHNTIDSDHLMEVSIRMGADGELVVSNPVFPKQMPADTNGTGLRNLENRFSLLMGRQIRVDANAHLFSVGLPL